MKKSGFTLIEMIFVLAIALITLAVGTRVFGAYLQRSSAIGSARIFARDLTLARSSAVQTRDPVVIRFDEGQLSYIVRNASGRVLANRAYGADSDAPLSMLDLDVSGDSLVFNGRGVLDLSRASGTLGSATFTAGGRAYTVSFNSLGASRIDPS